MAVSMMSMVFVVTVYSLIQLWQNSYNAKREEELHEAEIEDDGIDIDLG